MNLILPIDAILVPQGPEYQAVCRGLNQTNSPKPLVLPIPIGSAPLTRYLEKWQQARDFPNHPQFRVLLMGLCGSLSPQYNLGDIVLYQDCVCKQNTSEPSLRECDRQLTTLLHHNLKERASLVRGLTSDRLIWSAEEKCNLGQIYDAGVVDMEGFAALEVLDQAGVAVAMVRVIGDNCHHNIPDLTPALSPDGSLRAFPLALGLLRQPFAAARLIRGSLRGLKVLEQMFQSLVGIYES
ncbi:MAG: phosphorylase [Xenococcaceae cyanobacterium]